MVVRGRGSISGTLKDQETTRQRRPGRPSFVEAERRRTELIDSALVEFLANGFAGANLDRIASVCGISKMTIYRQIGSKEELFALVTEHAVGSLRLDYQTIIDQGGSPSQVIGGIVRLSQERSGSERLALLRLAAAEGKAFPELLVRMLDRTIEINQPVADYLQRIVAPTLDRAAAMRYALILMSMAVGGFLKFLDYGEASKPQWADDVTDLFLNGIRLADGKR